MVIAGIKANVLFREGELVEYYKYALQPEMSFVDYGLSVLTSRTLETYLDGQPFDFAEVYHELSCKEQLVGYEVHERFYEIGSHCGLKERETYLIGKGGT
jgi:N-acetyl-alpha-D-muramate 1-phosphate uridylyltransferase